MWLPLPVKGLSCNTFGVNYKHGKYQRNDSRYKPEFLSDNPLTCHCPNDNRMEFILSGGIYCLWFPSFFFFCTSTKRIPPLWSVIKTLRTGDADLRFYVTTVLDRWRKYAFLTRAGFPCTIHLIMQYIESVSEWSYWRMFIETWPHSELIFRYRASSI